MKMYRWRELRELLAPHGEIVAACATGLVKNTPDEPELRELTERIELDVGAEPGAIDMGHHMLAVVWGCSPSSSPFWRCRARRRICRRLSMRVVTQTSLGSLRL